MVIGQKTMFVRTAAVIIPAAGVTPPSLGTGLLKKIFAG